jgi:hypothetical protein
MSLHFPFAFHAHRIFPIVLQIPVMSNPFFSSNDTSYMVSSINIMFDLPISPILSDASLLLVLQI